MQILFLTVFDYGNKTKRKQTLSHGIFEFYWIKQINFFSFLWFIRMMNSKNTKMQKQNLKQKKQFIWIFSIYEWNNKCKQTWMMLGKNDLIQKLELWYQMLQAGNHGWQDGWWKLDGSTKKMIWWAIWLESSCKPETNAKRMRC